MHQQLDDNILEAVGIRYVVNPELSQEGVAETEEMCQKTIKFLEWLNETRPVCILVADLQNNDPHAVMVRARGKRIAFIHISQAADVRGMLAKAPNGMLSTRIVDVKIDKHGLFLLERPKMKVDYTPEEIGADWSNFEVEEMIMLSDEYFLSHDELSLVIRDMFLNDLEHADIEEFKLYVNLWMDSIRFNLSREVQNEIHEFISALSKDSRKEVQQIAIDIDHMHTKKGTTEVIHEMANVWWKNVMNDKKVKSSFRHIKEELGNDHRLMTAQLNLVEGMFKAMPGHLYRDVAKPFDFFSHLYYLSPPVKALKGVLSLLALRTLLCQELGLPLAPCYHERVEDEEMTQAKECGQEYDNGKVYLNTRQKGNKTDLIRVVYSLYDLDFFRGKNGGKVSKKALFEVVGKSLNVDLTNYDKVISRSFTAGLSQRTQLEIFNRMIEELKKYIDEHS